MATGPRRHADSLLAVGPLAVGPLAVGATAEAVGALVFLLRFSCFHLLYFPWLYRFLGGLSVLHDPLVLAVSYTHLTLPTKA